MSDAVTAVIVHYRTPQLLRRCHRSIRILYPDLPVIIVDGGSAETESIRTLQAIAENPHTEVILKPRNIGHGPGLHFGIKAARTPQILTLDSDCICQEGGFIEAMQGAILPEKIYATGSVVRVNREGVKVETGGLLYCRPVTALWDRHVYLRYPPFELHGAPCLRNEIHALRDGYTVVDFPVDSYVLHLKRGTRSRHGNHWAKREKIL